jgi:hypothetical protein
VSPRGVLLQAGLVGLVLAYPFAVVQGPWAGLGVLAGAALVIANFALMAGRLAGAERLLRMEAGPGPRALTARTMLGGGIRWLLTFFLLWAILDRFPTAAVVTGLLCVVASIALQAIFAYLRARRAPSVGADP